MICSWRWRVLTEGSRFCQYLQDEFWLLENLLFWRYVPCWLWGKRYYVTYVNFISLITNSVGWQVLTSWIIVHRTIDVPLLLCPTTRFDPQVWGLWHFFHTTSLENTRVAPRMDDVSTASHMTKISSRGPRLRILASLFEADGNDLRSRLDIYPPEN